MADVIDASVAIKWFIKEAGQEKALGLLEKVLNAPEHFAAPELFYFELSHIFNRLIQHPTKKQIELMEFVSIIGIQRFSFTPELFNLQREFQNLGLSGYDAAYVAVAKLTQGKWHTFDEKAHKKVEKLKLSTLLK
jgi:predicted nucleic acid-binding protein